MCRSCYRRRTIASRLLTGSREAFESYLETHPGVYYRSTGWLERGQKTSQPARVPAEGMARHQLNELIDKYGDTNGRYLHRQMNRYKNKHTQLSFIQTGIEPNDSFEASVKVEAQAKGWTYEKVHGSGDWSEENILTVPAGYRVKRPHGDHLPGIERVN